jgi:VanZ family protein
LARRRILYYWAPAAVWAAVILAASSAQLSDANTGAWLETIVTAMTGSPLSPTAFAVWHLVIRKLGHLTEYAIFGALAWRAFRGERTGSSVAWALAAVATAAALAGIDEWHQTFVPGRTGAASDVLIDICGATLSQIAIRHR